MSIVPFLLNELYGDDYYRPSRMLDQHFGCGLLPEQLLEPMTIQRHDLRPRAHLYLRPWRTAVSQDDTGSVVSKDKDKFQISLDVQQFSPNEITVKTVDNSIVVEGKHEEKQDEHGYISRHFVRRYAIPKGHDPKDIVSSLSSDGVLTVTAPKLAIEDGSGERVVQITQTGPVKAVKDASQDKKEAKAAK